IAVRVVDPPRDKERNQRFFPQFMYNEIPHGKQNWYVQTGGLWQPVRFEVKPQTFISIVHITPKVDGAVNTLVVLDGKSAGEAITPKRILIRAPDGNVV